MSEISIVRQSTGGYKVVHAGITYYFSDLNYAASPAGLKILPPTGSPVEFPLTALNHVAINEVRNFASVELAVKALDAAGVGKDKQDKPALPATGTVSLSGQPAAEDTVTIDDGVITAAAVFEFSGVKSNGAIRFIDGATPASPDPGDLIQFGGGEEEGDHPEIVFEFDDGEIEIDRDNIPVKIGATATVTMTNFIKVFNDNIADWKAYPSATADNNCTIVANEIGEEWDVNLAKEGDNITIVKELDDGADAEATEGNWTVPIGTNVNVTAANLAEVINEAKDDDDTNLLVHAEAKGAVVHLTHLLLGEAGNEELAKSGTNITVVGLAGGVEKTDITDLIAAISALNDD